MNKKLTYTQKVKNLHRTRNITFSNLKKSILRKFTGNYTYKITFHKQNETTVNI